jgi:REP element-mobilizing transposase RayT
MANTYTQIHIHAVFAVKGRNSLIDKSWKDELYRYISGIIQNNEHKVLAINGTADHIHIFFGMRPTQSISCLLQEIKGDSSKWINRKGFIGRHFSWQEGYGAFSYSKSGVNNVIDYIKNQEKHHKKRTFSEEYADILKKFGIEYDDRYVFKPVE